MSVTTRVTGRPVPSVPGGFFLIIIRKYEAELFHLNPSKKAVKHRYQASGLDERFRLGPRISCSWAEYSQGRVRAYAGLPGVCNVQHCKDNQGEDNSGGNRRDKDGQVVSLRTRTV